MKTEGFGCRISPVLLLLILSLTVVCESQEVQSLQIAPLRPATTRPPPLTERVPLQRQVYSILSDMPRDGMSLVDKIVFLDSMHLFPSDMPRDGVSLVDRIDFLELCICNGDCYDSYPTGYSPRRYPMCQTCHCDVMCHYYRDCCPGVLLKQNVTYAKEATKVSGCVIKKAVVLKPEDLEYNDYQTMITRCSIGESANGDFTREDQEKCELFDIRDQEQSRPVSSPMSGYTYRNIFCARCHNDSHDLDLWTAKVSCKQSAEALISSTRSKEELYSKLVNETSVKQTTCELGYNTPSPSKDLEASRTLDGTYKRFCTEVFPPLIDTCNATGLAEFRDPELEYACAMYESVFDGKYRNMFCFLCNQPFPYRLRQFEMMVMTPLAGHSGRLDFTALLDFGNEEAFGPQGEVEEVIDIECNATEYYDIEACACRELECSEGKYLDKDGTCRSLIESDMLGYRVCRRIDISTDFPILDVSRLRFRLSHVVHNFLAKQHTSYVLKFCPESTNISFYIEDLFAGFGTLEDFEERINSTREVYLSAANETLASVTSVRIATEFPCVEVLNTLETQCPSDPSFSIDKYFAEGPKIRGERTDIYYIGFSSTSQCAFVSLNKANFSFNEENQTTVFLPTGDQLPPGAVSIMESPDRNEETVRMCVSDYDQLTKVKATSLCQVKIIDDFDTWTIAGLISIASTVISLICLALTFTVYLILAPLRIGGGKNIMVLTVLLFIAQALYEFGMEQFENRDVCRAIGLMVHYTWLTSVFSMNACTVERFLKLCFPLKSRSFFLSERKPFMFATIYALLCPLIIVSSNVAANLTSKGDIGYGSPRICYINSRASRIFAFALPMGVILLSNVILLGFTLWTLRKSSGSAVTGDSGVNGGSSSNGGGGSGIQTSSSSVQSTKNNKVGLLGCVRLSVVTGTMWLLIFLYELIQSDVLSYIITALVGLQGLVFFLSMVLNKRVIRMLKKKAAEYSSGTGSTSSGSDSSHAKHHVGHKTSKANSEQQLLSNSKTNSTTLHSRENLTTSESDIKTTCLTNKTSKDVKT